MRIADLQRKAAREAETPLFGSGRGACASGLGSVENSPLTRARSGGRSNERGCGGVFWAIVVDKCYGCVVPEWTAH